MFSLNRKNNAKALCMCESLAPFMVVFSIKRDGSPSRKKRNYNEWENVQINLLSYCF